MYYSEEKQLLPMAGLKTQCIEEVDVCLFCVLLLGINIFQ